MQERHALTDIRGSDRLKDMIKVIVWATDRHSRFKYQEQLFQLRTGPKQRE